MKSFPGRGTLLNVLTVLIGGGLAMLLRGRLGGDQMETVFLGLGLCTTVLGVKVSLASRNMLLVILAVVAGGLIGSYIGIHDGLTRAAEGLRQVVRGDERFVEGLVTASVLFCVGPMTVLGCIQDGMERKIDLLAAKSLLDLFAALVFGVLYGPGVVAAAGVVLVVQGLLTAFAAPLSVFAEDREMVAEFEGTGGVLLLGVAASIFRMPNVRMADFLPALFLAPLGVALVRRLRKKEA